MKKINLAEVQAYIILRGSKLSMDDKKRVLVESGAEESGKELEMKRAPAAIRMLGSSFFQEYTSGKREKSQETYDHMAFQVEDQEESMEDPTWESEEAVDKEGLETLAMEDDDASLVLQFENAVMDTIQDDKELATYFNLSATKMRDDDCWRRPDREVFGLPSLSKVERKDAAKDSKASQKVSLTASQTPHAGCAANPDIGRQNVLPRRHRQAVKPIKSRPHS